MKTTRLSEIDALRGLALAGVLLANIPFSSNTDEIFQIRSWIIDSPAVNNMVKMLYHFLIDKKFITIFGILFGFGCYSQMKSAQKNNVNFRSYFTIRMLLLLLIGIIHAYLFWFGDIIRYYAICGILLLLLCYLPEKKIMRIALMFNIVLAATVFIINGILGVPDYSYDPSLIFEHAATESWIRYLNINFTIDPMINFLDDSVLTFVFSFGNILLGFWMGKVKFFEQPEKFRKHYKTIIATGVMVGTASGYLFWLINNGTIELTPALIWLPFFIVIGIIAQALSYLTLFYRFYRAGVFHKILSCFVPVGRMALSNYLLQTLFYFGIFYHAVPGLKLYGKVSMIETYLISVVLFGFQIILSNLWLRVYKQGPVEYLWKTISYRFFRSESVEAQRPELAGR